MEHDYQKPFHHLWNIFEIPEEFAEKKEIFVSIISGADSPQKLAIIYDLPHGLMLTLQNIILLRQNGEFIEPYDVDIKVADFIILPLYQTKTIEHCIILPKN